MTSAYTGLDTPSVFDWRISPEDRADPKPHKPRTGPKRSQTAQAASALRTDEERTTDNLARVARIVAKRRIGVQLGPLTNSPADIAKTARLLGKPNTRRSQ
jgi:hypothetical protein